MARRQRRRESTTIARSRSAARASGSGRPWPGESGARAGSHERAFRRRRGVEVAVLPLVAILGVLAWWLLPLGNGVGPSDPLAIASLDVPDVHALLIDPSDPAHVLFGSHAGIKESRDGGFTWESGSLQNVDAMIIATSVEDSSTIYVAGHDVFQISRDGGRTWQPMMHDLPDTDIHAFAQVPSEPQRLYAYVAGDRIFGSTDGGTTWAALSSQPAGQPLALASNGIALYAATPVGIEVSWDWGGTWSPVSTQPGSAVVSLSAPAVDPQAIYAGTPTGLLKSSDGGESWQAVGPQDVSVLALAVAPSDAARVMLATADGDIYRSDDGGVAWLTPR